MPRDYKRPPKQPAPVRGRGRSAPSRLVWFVSGCACGVLATLGVLWLEPSPESVLASIETMRGRQPAPPPPEAKPRFDFYHLLPEMEVAVPEHELEAPPGARVAEAEPAVAAGADQTYLIQVGSFRKAEEAEKLRASLALQGIEAHVQSVAIDGRDTWHRVRLGPFQSVARVNELRQRLRELGLGEMVVKLKG